MAQLIVSVHELVQTYIDTADDRSLAIEIVTWKAKTDTNALPFNEKNRLLSV